MQLRNIISRIRGESKTVGLDIGHRLIKVAVVDHKRNSMGTLVALEQEPIPEGIVVDNEIKNAIVLADKIQALLSKAMPNGIEGDFVMSVNWTSGILCDRILVKFVPRVQENELVLQAAMGRSPFDDAGNVLDYSIVARREDGIEAMIVAGKKDVLSTWVNLFKTLNIKLAAIDVDAFALSNIYTLSIAQDQHNSQNQYEYSGSTIDEDDSVLLLNLGFNKSYLAYLHNNHFNTARSIMGCSIHDLQDQISVSLGITAVQANSVLIGKEVIGLELDASKVKSSMEFVLDEISMRIDNAIRYFSSSDNYKRAGKMVLASGGNIKGLIPYLSDRFSLEVFQLNPFRAVQIDPANFPGRDLNAISGIYSVALGLALRRF